MGKRAVGNQGGGVEGESQKLPGHALDAPTANNVRVFINDITERKQCQDKKTHPNIFYLEKILEYQLLLVSPRHLHCAPW